STVDTQVLGGRLGTFFTTFVQVLPLSFVTCTFPSSVPTQMTFPSFGDSAMLKIVSYRSASELSTVNPPDCSWCSFAGSLVVRSGEIRSHDSPLSFERNRNCEPTYMVPGWVALM